MTIPFTCPHCGVKTDVAEEYAGQSGPCIGCGKTVTIAPRTDTPGYTPPGNGGSHGWALIIVVVLVVGALLFMCAGVLGFAMLGVRSRPPMMAPMATAATPVAACGTNMQQIGLAMQQYVQEHGSFPPAYTTNDDGKPMHSWRVLLLPYLGEQALYDQFDMNEPWDGPNNQLLHAQMPQVYRCTITAGPNTPYAMIVGPGMLSDGASTTKPEDIADGPSNTVAIVEFGGSDITWCEPRDLKAEDIDFASNGPIGVVANVNIMGQINVVFADGIALAVPVDMPAREWRDLLTIAGGERTDRVPRIAPVH
jgi:hypothetical protein